MALIATTAQAQSPVNYRFGGLMMDRDGMMSNDMYTLSQVNFGFGTARSMAMAGAFTSLGGDISSMGINPAGLGMYRSNDVSVTPMLSFTSASNSAESWGSNSRNRFAMGNVGAVINLKEGSGSLLSLNIGVGYNRVADFNYSYGYTSQSAPSLSPYRSIVDAFSRQLGQGGVFPQGGALNYDYSTAYYWGGALAYNAYLLDAARDAEGDYWTSANSIGVNATTGHTVGMESRGSIGEYDLAIGMNFANKLYVGATLGIQSVNWRRQIYYGEDYIYTSTPVDSQGEALEYPASMMDYNQAVNISGVGVNLKLGVIYRPIPSLRIGVALHTPTYYALERTYQAYMSSNFNPSGDTTPSLEDLGSNAWEFTSPTRFMAGISYSFSRFAVISVDYERDWYNGMRVVNVPDGFDIPTHIYNQEFKDNFKGSNTLRVGAELKPFKFMALRAGYGIATGALRNNKALYYNRPLNYKTTCISAGVGFAIGATTIDLAYQNIDNSMTDYMLYYAVDGAGRFDTASPTYSTKLKRNYIMLTWGYKF